ncbi:unnamed protein product [Darwinula stevensoni]|uniref:Protein JTB n=1 Tax=Darwinula stevensoni TaxID=69355 RepID=A0A7R8XBQ9_9CRUS|nr:unnamed protein product [Darwinula stevensoni]CAG0886740.1 unnamed protein product [Darwinula stevensoni]
MVKLSILALIFESELTPDSEHNHETSNLRNSSLGECWAREAYTIIKPCHHCSEFEVASLVEACMATGYKEVLQCQTTRKEVSRKCDKPIWMEERKFWMFELTFFLIGIASGTFSQKRQKQLNDQMLARINRQIAAGI